MRVSLTRLIDPLLQIREIKNETCSDPASIMKNQNLMSDPSRRKGWCERSNPKERLRLIHDGWKRFG